MIKKMTMITLWLIFFLLPSLAAPQAAPLQTHINQSDVRQAMADMRSRSFHGFVILLKLLNALPNSVPSTGTTYLMPTNQQLADANFNLENLRDFIGMHSIPMALTMRDIMHFPDGSLIPSMSPNRMLSISNGARSGSGIYINNARIVTPNVCVSAQIRCHGINALISVNSSRGNSAPNGLGDRTKMVFRHAKMHHRVNSSSSAHSRRSKRSPIIH